MSPASSRAAAIALALGGCMRIYPDPDLPDVRVDWFADNECIADTDRVTVALAPVAAAGTPVEPATVPCADASVRLVDVPREHYVLTAQIVDPTGAVFGVHEEDVDLRDGLNERISAFFGRSFDVVLRASWTFDLAASCDSLSATDVSLGFAMPDQPVFFAATAPCEAGMLIQSVPFQGLVTVTARATAANVVVATSPASAPVALAPGQVVDLGTLTLSPCAPSCPDLDAARE